ncbi:L-fucose/L-arabinose isomerase family protein [Paludibaculum fermentans]|uniref:L-fucose/L-arabinose isomerase family protein n=1 Tax=Paludibaculum fermentans TaxID=1473598 RepID=A0A7S7SP70_PALFE|nr:L-fucose/L-arabinose isomerase family protein [Paludibaculum fermentans]QOY90850.1 L-fucose/L-arabinose isomerase family protein [Paludibaculum fermentans]
MRVPRRKPRTARVGLFGVGYHVYWKQFPGLLDELHNKLNILDSKIQANRVEVVNFGIVDKAQDAYALAARLKAADLDLVFCDMVTYATSATFGIIVRSLDVPIVLVALQPLAALDYANATTYMQLVNDDFCSVPEFTGVAIRMGKPAPEVILGTLENDPQADAEIADWCDVAMALNSARRARIGHFGHPIEHMLDMQTDQTALTAAFGCHIVQTEADDLLRLSRDVTGEEIDEKRQEILELFDTPDPGSDPLTRRLSDEHLTTAARVAVTLDKFVEHHELDGLAYYYEGEPGSELRTIVTNLIVGNSLLTAAGFPMCGESDLKTCLAMLLMDRIDIGGSFAEFHPIDFKEGFVLVGHDGPHHINIADGKPVLRSLTKYHGKPGNGASVEFRIKDGPITMLSIGLTAQGRFKFVLAEGQSVDGPIPATGNTNTRGFFEPDVRTFLKRWVAAGPTHHFALGIGHRAQTLARIATALGIEHVIV